MTPFIYFLIVILWVTGSVESVLAQTKPIEVDPRTQKESDWVDDRWNKTDLGIFHASILPLPNGIVTKGLSVKVGDNATIVYDTATATMRGGWTGGFLKFLPGRFGLIDSPRPLGEVKFISPSTPAWENLEVRWSGLHSHGNRIVADYMVDGLKISESPWFVNSEGMGIFIRTLDIPPHTTPISLNLFAGEGRVFSSQKNAELNYSTLQKNGELLVTVIMGTTPVAWRYENEKLQLQLDPTTKPSTLKICWGVIPEPKLPQFLLWAKNNGAKENLQGLKSNQTLKWPALTTRGQRNLSADSYVIDTLTMPYDNPWKALMFTSGVGFLPDGRALVSTIHGDVWMVSGIDEKLETLTWKRFATGLFQPLGLTVRDGGIFVLGRDQITRLHDADNNGEADYYENYFNGIHTSSGGHDYVTSLEKDDAGNFYYVDPEGIHKVAADGRSKTILASGWRNPNGMGVSPDGKIITVAPQQGTWTPSSLIAEVKPGEWYGFGGPKTTPNRPSGYEPPLCWIPHSVDNSSGSQTWVTSDRWGPLKNHLIHFSFGRCAQFLVLREEVDGVTQGAITQIPGRFLSGAMRGTFNPKDGQMYVVGSTGWQSSAAREGSLQRVRFTGVNPLLPIEIHTRTNGLRIKFSTPLDRSTVEDAGSYAYSHWNYRYSSNYGSADYSVSNPEKEGHDTLVVHSAKLMPDGCSVFIEILGMRPVMQWELKYNLNALSGKSSLGQVFGTIHRFGADVAKGESKN